MENEKNNNGYNNKNYLNKREDPIDNAASLNQENEIKNKTEEKIINPPEESDKVKPIENIDDGKLEDNQKEMHPEINIRKNKNYTIPLIFGVIVLIIIGVVAVYFLLDTQEESPQQIVKSSMQEMQKVKTYNYNGVMEFDVENKENSESFNFDIELSGKADQTDLNNIKAFNNIKTTVNTSIKSWSQEISFNLDIAQFGQEKIYLKLNDYDLGMAGAIRMTMGPDVDSSMGVWYLIDSKELENLEDIFGDNGIDNVDMMTYDMNKIMELYSKYELLKFQEDLGDIKLGNVDTHHYKVKLDGIALINFYADIIEEMTYDEVFEQIEKDIKKYDYMINDIVDNISMEVWIGKEDRFIYRIKMDGEFDRKFMEILENKMIIEGDLPNDNLAQKTTDDFEIAFNVNINMDNFNGPVVINEPKETENLMEILGEMFGGFLGTGVTGTELDTDADGLPDYIEDLYGTDLNNPDTDGDGYKDGEEVENGYDPLVPGNAKIDYDKLLK